MKVDKKDWFFYVLLAAFILMLAFEARIKTTVEGFHAFQLSEIKLKTMTGATYHIQDGFAGYVVFYSDILGCSACMRKLGYLRELNSIYEEIGFFAVLRGGSSKQYFGELMTEYQVPGEYLVDELSVLQNRMGLGDHPLLLFFNRRQKLIATMPMDVEHERLLLQYHRYIGEM